MPDTFSPISPSFKLIGDDSVKLSDSTTSSGYTYTGIAKWSAINDLLSMGYTEAQLEAAPIWTILRSSNTAAFVSGSGTASSVPAFDANTPTLLNVSANLKWTLRASYTYLWDN